MLQGNSGGSLPVLRSVSSDGAVWGDTAPPLLEGLRMIGKAPSYEFDQRPDDDHNELQGMTYKPEVAFRWPSGCLWSVLDHRPTSDT
jgi:hypothetical protein